MADMADNLVTLIDEKWSGPAKPDIIEKVLARPDIGKFQSKDYVIVYPLGSGRHVHVTRDYYNVIYGFEILCFTPTSSDRLQELYEEVIDILYNWYLTGVDMQRVVDQRDLSDKKTGKFKYTIHIELEAIMAYKGAAVQSGIPSGDASQYAPKGAEYVVLAMDDTLTNEKLHSALAGAELHSPKTHASSHQSGGGDAIKLDDLATPDDNTDLNASTTKHGLLRKLDNVVTHYLDGQGGWSTPAGGGGGAPTDAKYVVTELDETLTEELLHSGLSGADLHDPKAHASSHQSGGGDAVKLDDLAAPDDNTDLDASVDKHGLLKKLGGGTSNFLRADGAWAAPPGGGGSGGWTKVYDTILGSKTTSVTISSLDGNEDEIYMLIIYFKNYTSGGDIGLRINNDSDAIYGWQEGEFLATAETGGRYEDQTEFTIGSFSSTYRICMSRTIIYAQTGHNRAFLTEYLGMADRDAGNTLCTKFVVAGGVYAEGSTNVTSLVIVAGTNQIGAGTHIVLWKKTAG